MTSRVRKMAAVDPRWPESLPVKVNRSGDRSGVRGHSIRRLTRPVLRDGVVLV